MANGPIPTCPKCGRVLREQEKIKPGEERGSCARHGSVVIRWIGHGAPVGAMHEW